MNAIFYKNNSEKEKIDKSLTQVSTSDIILLDGSSITDPVIQYQGLKPEFNYMYLSDFNRYYYVKEITNNYQDIWTLYLHVDVLKSFKTQILSHRALIERQENVFNMYLADNLVPMQNDSDQYIKKFSGGSFDTDNTVILVNPYINHLVQV